MLIRLLLGSVGDTKCCHLLWIVSWKELVANQGGLTLLVVLFHSLLHSTTVNWEIFVIRNFCWKNFRVENFSWVGILRKYLT